MAKSPVDFSKLWSSAAFLVFLGGMSGTFVRFEVTVFSNSSLIGLVLVNTIGSGVLGLVSVHPFFKESAMQKFWAVGFCGGFTTMSGLALLPLLEAGATETYPWSIPLSFVLGFGAYLVGRKSVDWLTK